ncbi:hypothetical protein [Streptomyces sp. cmx-18-6]|uniref:hypothetical protein n=1 Tax=Streptomyces sp. cmx-18-6 TaxID=2790930 RepID=UPI00398139F6
MKTSTLKRAAARVSTAAVGATAVLALTAGTASAETVVRWYSYTAKGAKSCNAAANAAGPEYYCKAVHFGGSAGSVWALTRP